MWGTRAQPLSPILPPECLKSTKLRCYQAAVVVIASALRGTFWHFLELMSAIAICVSHNTAGSSHSACLGGELLKETMRSCTRVERCSVPRPSGDAYGSTSANQFGSNKPH